MDDDSLLPPEYPYGIAYKSKDGNVSYIAFNKTACIFLTIAFAALVLYFVLK